MNLRLFYYAWRSDSKKLFRRRALFRCKLFGSAVIAEFMRPRTQFPAMPNPQTTTPIFKRNISERI
jgi:hypothetical protein